MYLNELWKGVGDGEGTGGEGGGGFQDAEVVAWGVVAELWPRPVALGGAGDPGGAESAVAP